MYGQYFLYQKLKHFFTSHEPFNSVNLKLRVSLKGKYINIHRAFC